MRKVYLNQSAEAHLRAWLDQLVSFTKSKRFPDGKNPRGLAFPGRHGGYRSEEHVLRWEEWKKILKRAALAKREVRWHGLRHTCASSLVSGWWGRR